MAQYKPKIPQTGEFWTLKSGVGEADLQITAVNMVNTFDNQSMVHIEGVPIRQRMGMDTSSGIHSGNMYDTVFTQPNMKFTMSSGSGIKFTNDSDKGMAVDIKTIETVDGTKAQIVLSVGTKSVIAFETEAFEDDVDAEVNGQTAQVKAKKAAEAHAKDVLKRTFQ